MIDGPWDSGATRHMLVVDDEASVRLVLRRLLGRHGWTVAEAASGEEALSMLDDDARCIDAAIVDLHLPGLSGTALCQRIVGRRPELAGRLVIASGDAVLATAALRQLDGCRALGKPFELAELDAVVRALAVPPPAG